MNTDSSIVEVNRQIRAKTLLGVSLLFCFLGGCPRSTPAQTQGAASQGVHNSPTPQRQTSSAQMTQAPLSQPRGTYQMRAPYSSSIFNTSNDATRPGISTKFAAPTDPMHRVIGQPNTSDGISTGGMSPNGIGAPASRSYTKITPAGNGANAPIGMYGGSSFGSSAGGSVR